MKAQERDNPMKRLLPYLAGGAFVLSGLLLPGAGARASTTIYEQPNGGSSGYAPLIFYPQANGNIYHVRLYPELHEGSNGNVGKYYYLIVPFFPAGISGCASYSNCGDYETYIVSSGGSLYSGSGYVDIYFDVPLTITDYTGFSGSRYIPMQAKVFDDPGLSAGYVIGNIPNSDYSEYFEYNGSYNFPGWGTTPLTRTLVDGDEYVPPGPSDTTTRIVSIAPAHGEVVSTSTPATVSVEVYVNPKHVGNEITYSLWDINSARSLFGLGGTQQTWRFTATSSGLLAFSTTTSEALAEGSYQSTVDIVGGCLPFSVFGKRCYLPLRNPDGQIVASSTTWSAGAPSAFGQNVSNVFSRFDEIFTSTSTATTSWAGSYCVPGSGSFEISGCLAGLIVPSGAQLKGLLDQAQSTLFARFPWGYLNRIVIILTDPTIASSSLPSIDVEMQVGGSTKELHLDLFGSLAGPGTILATATTSVDGEEVGILDSFMGYFDFFAYLFLAWWIVKEILDFQGTAHFFPHPRGGKNALTERELRRIDRSYDN